jgi:hypothetical protein
VIIVPSETPTNTPVVPTNTPVPPTNTPQPPTILVPTNTPTQPSVVVGETVTPAPTETAVPTGTPEKVAGVTSGENMPTSGVGSTFSNGNSVSIFLLLILAAFAGATGWQIRPKERRR